MHAHLLRCMTVAVLFKCYAFSPMTSLFKLFVNTSILYLNSQAV